MEEEISLIDLWNILKRNIGTIVAVTTLGFLSSLLITLFFVVPTYESQADILVSRSVQDETGQGLSQDINASLQLINTYSDIITNEVILVPVIDQLEDDYTVSELQEKISVNSDNDSQVFSISVRDDDPNEAARISNTIAEVFQEEIDNIMMVDNVTIISNAEPNPNPVSPNVPLNLVAGALAGLVVGVIITFIKELTDTTVSSEDYVIETVGWPLLGKVSIISVNDLKRSEKKAVPSIGVIEEGRTSNEVDDDENKKQRYRRRV